MEKSSRANGILAINTVAFTACFMVWTMYGVLITWLVDNRVLELDKGQMGWLIGIPILTGSVLRLPVGLLADRIGGKPVFIALMLFSAVSLFATSYAQTYWHFLLAGLMFGVSGASFAVGIAYTSLWFPKERQGTALGVFGMGNAGAALTTLFAPRLIRAFTNGAEDIERWRLLPQFYAAVLIVVTIAFALMTVNKRVEGAAQRSMTDMLRPLSDVRVWRFGLYYFLVFGAFVALAQWLVPYYLNVYGMTLAMAGLLASVFSFPSGVIRALGGWASDKFGARATMYWVFGTCAVFFLLLVAPRMDITSPGDGVMAARAGTVESVSQTAVIAAGVEYQLKPEPPFDPRVNDERALVLPTFRTWQEPAVEVGQTVEKKQLIAKGKTHVFFQANVWVFTTIVFLAGIMMGVGKAAVYKHIPDYFPGDVGVVGGIVGVIGGLGGFVCPILFGYLLKWTGLWTTCWLFLAVVTLISLVWMHRVIMRMTSDRIEPGKSE